MDLSASARPCIQLAIMVYQPQEQTRHDHLRQSHLLHLQAARLAQQAVSNNQDAIGMKVDKYDV